MCRGGGGPRGSRKCAVRPMRGAAVWPMMIAVKASDHSGWATVAAYEVPVVGPTLALSLRSARCEARSIRPEPRRGIVCGGG